VDEAPELCRLIERCLVRDPKQRLRDIGEARIFLQDGSFSGTNLSFSQLGLSTAGAAPARTKTSLPLLAGLALACLAVGTLIGWKALARPEPAPLLHTMIPSPEDADFSLGGGAPGPAAISPDGTKVAFTALDETGVAQLYLRHLDKGESVVLSGTEGSAYPFWSPDSKFIGFFEPGGGKLKKVAADGGPPVTLCSASNGKGGSWNRAGEIIFAPQHDDAIYKVADIGGDPVRLTTLAPEHDSHRHPRFLPDGEQFVFTGRVTAGGSNEIFLASLDTTVAPRVIVESQAHADYANGHLMFVREDVLMAAPYSPDQERLTEGAMPLVENILSIAGAAVSVFSPSETGMLVFQTGTSSQADMTITWLEIASGALETIGEPGQVFHPYISPDGTQAVLEVRNLSDTGIDLWLMDLITGLRTRFTFAAGDETRPCWSRSGADVYYTSFAAGVYRIMQQPVEGQGGGAIILESDRTIAPTSADPSDQFLLVDYEREDGNFEMRRLALGSGTDELVTLATAPEANLGGGLYSPDGRWIAYHTETAAAWDVFVTSADGGVRKWQVTTDGSAYPKWNGDGTELWVSKFNGDLRVYAVNGTGQTFRVGNFTQTLTVSDPGGTGCFYDLHPDGNRILQTGADPEFRSKVSHLHLVTDWQRGLAR